MKIFAELDSLVARNPQMYFPVYLNQYTGVKWTHKHSIYMYTDA